MAVQAGSSLPPPALICPAGSSSSSMTSRWILGLPATPAACALMCPHTATLSCPQQRSAVLCGPLLAGPMASDEAARSLAAMGLVRLPSCSELSFVGGSRMLGMKYHAILDYITGFFSGKASLFFLCASALYFTLVSSILQSKISRTSGALGQYDITCDIT
jgi:hypothetical protein